MKPGDVLETAIWMDGTETEEQKRRFAQDFQIYLARAAGDEFILGPMTIVEKRPGDDRVPPVPDSIQGPDVRLLVCEATVIDSILESESLFVADLDPKDLHRLRTILRRVHQWYNPGKPELSDEKCDEYINRNGPNAALEALREQVGVKVH